MSLSYGDHYEWLLKGCDLHNKEILAIYQLEVAENLQLFGSFLGKTGKVSFNFIIGTVLSWGSSGNVAP